MAKRKCWFCRKEIAEEQSAYFSTEWDAYYHLGCFIKALRDRSPEAEVIADKEWKEEE